MPLSYTSTQLTREVQLLIHEQVMLVDQIIEAGAGVRALNIDPESDYAQGGHPDYLTDLSNFEVWKFVNEVESYVRTQGWSDDVSSSVSALRYAAEGVFTTSTLKDYEDERLAYPEPDGIPEPGAIGGGDVVLGHFYQGILFQLLVLAEARLKIDKGERLTMSEIASLIDIREATVVTNAHRKNFATVEEEGRRYAEAEDVLPWLVKNGYRPTTRGGIGTKPRPAKRDADEIDYVVVPVAKDGVWFDPQSRHDGRYSIGAGPKARKFTDYYEALAALMSMPSPRWQTKTNGIRGIAFGIRFDRVPRADLDRALAEMNHPL